MTSTILGVPEWAALILLAIVGTLGVLFAGYLAVYRSPERAAEETSRRAVGATAGAGATAVSAAAVGTEAVLQLPEILITLVGIGSILAGVSWEMFAATALIVYVVGEAINGGPAGS